MIKIEKRNTYKTFFWAAKGEVYDTERNEYHSLKIFGIKVFSKNRKFQAEYFENGKRITGFQSVTSDLK